MPGTTIGRGNELYDFVIGPTLTPASVNATTSAEQTFTVAGLQLNDVIAGVSLNAAQTAGIGIVNYRVSAANTLAITFSNSATSGALTPASGQYLMEVLRMEVSSLSSLPTTAI